MNRQQMPQPGWLGMQHGGMQMGGGGGYGQQMGGMQQPMGGMWLCGESAAVVSPFAPSFLDPPLLHRCVPEPPSPTK